MSTKARFPRTEIGASNPIFHQIRTTIETAFYGNNVTPVTSLKEAYKLAKKLSWYCSNRYSCIQTRTFRP